MTSPDESPLPELPRRARDGHKGNYGRALLIGGSRGMAGALGLAGMASLRGGAGLVQLGVPEACLETVAAYEPSYMTLPLPCDAAGRIDRRARATLEAAVEPATAIAIGPGLGSSPELMELVSWLFAKAHQPMVFDADALNSLSEDPSQLGQHAGPRILTPHPGEFTRLIGGEKLPRASQEERASALAQAHDLVIVLKGQHTLVTDGRQQAHNTTGNPGMGTGGSGDVLTGITTALLCQGMAPWDAARLAVYVHGLAGDLAASELGEVSLIAHDLVDWLPKAFMQIETR